MCVSETRKYVYINVKLLIKPPERWVKQVPEGHIPQLLKAVYRTVQAARRWHSKISTGMEDNGYRAVNSEKRIFMKRDEKEFIISLDIR